jgi:Acetyltransferase (GNAT) family
MSNLEEGEEKETPSKIKEVENITNASIQEWITKLSPSGVKHMVLIAITVNPSFQGQGVGKGLIGWGTGIADREGVYAWVHASEAGGKAFEKRGFREVGRLEVDLDGFAGEGVRNEERGDGRWGVYVFRYMKREARELGGKGKEV